MAIRPWRTLSSTIAFQNQWYMVRQDTVQLPDGRILPDYFVSVRPDVAVVFSVTPAYQVLLVRQYKQGVRKVTLELPAGTFRDEPPLEAARRELMEETGYRCEDLVSIGTVWDDASKNSNRVHLFLGTDAYRAGEQALDENEQASGIEVVLLPLADLLEQIRTGEIAAQSTIVAIYRALDEFQRRGIFSAWT